VQAERAAAYPPSMDAGHPIRLAAMSTMADGIAVAQPGAVPFGILTGLHVPVRTVTEDAIARALVLLMERSKQVVEPAGVPGVSVLLDDPEGLEPPVVAVLSGGNVDLVLLQRVLRYGLAAAGRYLTLSVQMADNPGSLAALLGVLAQCGVNVLSVDHVWTDPTLAVGQVEVVVQLETRGPDHSAETLEALQQAGFGVRATA
jgi:threonine dehydratase